MDLIAKIGGFTGPLDQAGRALDKRTREMERRSQAFAKSMSSAFGGLATRLGGFVGGFFAVNKAVDGFFSSIDRADKMRDLSIQLGIGVEKLSALAYAASQTGVDLDTFSTSLLKLEKNMSLALDPKSKQRGLFDALLGEGKADLKDTEHLLAQLGDAFKSMGDSPHKARIEMELFGKTGAKMAEFMSLGAKGIKDLTDRARELGVVIDQEAADGADRFNDKLGDVKAVAAGLGTQLASALMPQVEKLLDWMIEFGSDPGNVEKLVKDTTEAFNNLASAISSVAKFGGEIYGVLDTLQAKLIGLEQGGQRAAIGLMRALSFTDWERGILDRNEAALGLGPPAAAEPRAGRKIPRLGKLPGLEQPVDEEQARRLSAYLDGNSQETEANAAAKKKAAEAARLQKEREEELAKAVKKAAEAQADFTRQLEDLVAQQGGPLAESQLKYRREEEELTALWRESSTPVAAELEKALNALHEARDKDAEAIRKQLDTGGEQLKQMQAELDLMNLQTQAERDRAAFLLDNPTATSEQADAAARLQGQLDQTRQGIAAMDEFRDSFADFAAEADFGADAFKDFADTVVNQLKRIAAEWLTTQLFGEQGSSGPSWLSSIIGFFTGSGSSGANNFGIPLPGSGTAHYAMGTDFHPGGRAIVGEHGPEIVNLPRGSSVTPNHALGGLTQINNFNLPRRYDNRSEMQIAQATARSGRVASRRNGG